MKVTIEANPRGPHGLRYYLRIQEGYRTGELVRRPFSETPVFDINAARLGEWARTTGYEVVQDTPQEDSA